MSKRVVIAVFLSIVMLQIVSASIAFTEPRQLYSIGDELNLNITLQTNQAANGFFTTALECDGEEVEIYKIPHDSKAGQVSSFSIKATLDKTLIGSLQGDCFVKGKYGGEEGRSSKFEISSDIVVTIDIQGNVFEPRDDVVVSGSAFLKNGNAVDGEVVLEINKAALSYETTSTNGQFSYTFTLPKAIPSGGYDLQARVSHKDPSGNILNLGNTTEHFKVKQVIQDIEVALSNTTVKPGTEIKYQVVLYDQVLIKTIQDVSVKLIAPNSEIKEEKVVSSGVDENYFTIGNAFTPGTWTVQASAGGLSNNKTFIVSELKNISVVRENATLLVVNTGNVPYNANLEVLVGDVPEIIELNLDVGEEKRFRLFAPDGEYAIGISSESQQLSLGSTFLTGNAVKISDLDAVNAERIKLIVWVLVVILLAVVVFKVYRKFRRNRVVISPSSSPAPVSNIKEKEDNGSFFWKSSTPAAATAKERLMPVNDFGKKEECTVVALKVKNYDEIAKYKGTEHALETLVRAAGLARAAKAQVTREDGFTVMIFSSAGMRIQNPHLKAVRVGKEIEALLKAHNRKHARKIAFGIGVATGEMVVEKHGPNIIHTSVGTLIPTAKKIASHAYESLLLHDSTHNRLRNQIKVSKGIGGLYWTVQSFVEREQHNEFIKKFMERRADESKSF